MTFCSGNETKSGEVTGIHSMSSSILNLVSMEILNLIL